MTEKEIIYDDGEIAVALVQIELSSDIIHMAIRWLKPEPYQKDGKEIKTTNLMGGETDWFIVPFSFAVSIAKGLIEQKVSGMPFFKDKGFSDMVKWLVDHEEINDAMCY